MDFNLSSICDMLAGRIEDYKTTSKKRRIERDSYAAKAKTAKSTHYYPTVNSLKKHGRNMYASTPIETPKLESQQFTRTAIFSSINKLSSATARSFSRNLNTQAKRLAFDEENSTKVEEQSDMNPATFASATKTSHETLRRRRLAVRQRTNIHARKLVFDEDDHNTEEFLSKDSANEEQFKTIVNVSEDTAIDTLTKVLTPLSTPKRNRVPRKCIKARRLKFDDAEDNSFLSESSEEKNGFIKSPPTFKSNSIKEQDLVESLPNDCVASALVSDSQEMSSSVVMVLNVGILIRPIRKYVFQNQS